MNETEQLADFIAALELEDLPPHAIEMAKLAIRDTVGVTIFGSTLEWARIAAEFARESGGIGKATVWGHDWTTTAPYAALANGTAAHGFEMDDRHHAVLVHNGASTVSAAAALAEHAGASGRQFVLAVACGYEVTFRVARAAQRCGRRFYGSTWTVMGVAAAAAKALDLDQRGLMNALAIAGTNASGNQEFTQDPFGTMVKRLQGGGWPAHSGVTAALLAQKGFTGPSSILEGKHGVLRSFCMQGEPNMDALVEGLGEGFEVEGFETKAYPAWGGSHPAIEAVRQLRSEFEIGPEAVHRISVGCYSRIHRHALMERPRSLLTAQHHLQFIVAAAFYYDMRDPTIWDDHILEDSRVGSMAERVEVHVDDELDEIDRQTPGEAGIKVTLELRNGERRSAWVRHAKGNPGNPMTRDDIDAKFRLLAEKVLPEARVERLLQYLDSLPEDTDPVALSGS